MLDARMMIRRMKGFKARFDRTKVLGGILVLACLGVLLILYSTSQWGPWALSDATAYITSSQNLLNGHGLSLPRPSGRFEALYHFPPGFPWALSLLGLLGMDGLAAARWLNALLFGVSIFIIGFLVLYAVRKNWLALASSSVVLSSPTISYLASGAMSELLLLAGALFALWHAVRYVTDRRRMSFYLACLGAAVAASSRYLGVPLLGATAVGVVIFQRKTWKSRICDGLVLGGLGILPLAAWMTWIATVRDVDLSGRFRFAPEAILRDLRHIRISYLRVAWDWLPFSRVLPFPPYRIRLGILFVIFAIHVVMFLFLVRNHRKRNLGSLSHRPGFVALSFVVLLGTFYVIFLTWAYLASERRVYLDQRMLMPVFLFIVLAFVLLWMESTQVFEWGRIPASGVFLILALMISSNTPLTLEKASDLHHQGYGFTSRAWRTSPTLAALRELPEKLVPISNEEEAILLNTGRPAYDVKVLRGGEPPEVFYRYGDDPDDEIQRKFRNQEAVLVLFDTAHWVFAEMYQEQAEEMEQAFVEGLYTYGSYSDGSIYFYEPYP